MRHRSATVLLALALSVSGCLMPNQGTPIFVDTRAGNFWSGEALLIEVSEDQTQCRVAVRDRALIVSRRWVDCKSVHVRDSAPLARGTRKATAP